MRAMVVERQALIEEHPMVLRDLPIPETARGQVRVRVSVCGVCHTDLHVAEGDLPLGGRAVIPGHQVVGVVEAVGPEVEAFTVGDRVGVPWLHSTCGRCRFCRTGAENLCPEARFTGYHVDGGFAEYMIVGEDFTYPIPEGFPDLEAAPLLCAGIIGYRALRLSGIKQFMNLRSSNVQGGNSREKDTQLSQDKDTQLLTRRNGDIQLRTDRNKDTQEINTQNAACRKGDTRREDPRSGDLRGANLGLYGFGASAHIAAQIARHWDCNVYAFTRSEAHRELARRLGAVWAGGVDEDPGALMQASIIFAPAGSLVPVALERLDRGGTVCLAGIWMSEIPCLTYERHLYQEKTLRSVTASTRQDARELLELAAVIPIHTDVQLFSLDEANHALELLKHSRLESGAAVLRI
jgi:propanol-preferring alcohol dehydrogenase